MVGTLQLGESLAMLTQKLSDQQLPQDHLTYAAFRLAAIDTLMQIEMAATSPGGTIDPVGFLEEIPVLAEVALVVQVDLLADTWQRHRDAERRIASLLDSAIVYAACHTAARIVREDPDLARSHLASGPESCGVVVDASLPQRLLEQFDCFGSDVDFLTLEQFADTDPALGKRIKQMLGISKSQVKKLEAVLARAHASPEILAHLHGLLSEEEIQAWSRYLVPPLVVSLRAVAAEVDTPSDTSQAFINRKTGALFTASDEELRHLDEPDYLGDSPPDWQLEAINQLKSIRNSEDWLELPSCHEFHEWDVMAEFCQSVQNDAKRDQLLDAIRGSGAFGRFKDIGHRLGLIEDWYRFRDQRFADFVAMWLRANGIAYKK
jgi:hypothetical protein